VQLSAAVENTADIYPRENAMRAAIIAGILGVMMMSETHAQQPGMMPSPTTLGTMLGTMLTVQAEAQLKAAPDMASISAGVVTTAATAQEALAQNAKRMTAMLAALKEAKVEARDMQTSGVSLQPQYIYNNNEAPKLTGYQVTNTVDVVIRKLDGLGPVLDTLATKGASNMNGPNFSIYEPDPIMDEARTKAVQKAVKRAGLYAQAAGLRVKRIVAITEGGNIQQAPMPYQGNMVAQSKMADDTPIAPGRVGVSANVTMTFELEK
jgi:uncharacterized protein